MTDDRHPEYLARLIRNGYVEGQVRGLREQGHTFKKIAAMLNLSLDHVKQFNAEDTGRQISRRRSRTEQLEAENAALLAEVELRRARERQTDGLLERVQDGEMALAQENAALREIAQAVANAQFPTDEDGEFTCPWCITWPGHTPDCPVVKARALLGTNT